MPGFHEVFREIRKGRGFSGYRLGQSAGVNAAYIYRMERAGGSVPRRDLLDALIKAMGLDEFDTARLHIAAGYCPAAIARVGTWDASLDIVSQVLADGSLSSDEREEFRQIIKAVASRWIATE